MYVPSAWLAERARSALGHLPSKGFNPGKKTKANSHLDLPPSQLGLFVCLILAHLLDQEQIRTSFAPSELSFASYQIFIVFPSVAVKA